MHFTQRLKSNMHSFLDWVKCTFQVKVAIASTTPCKFGWCNKYINRLYPINLGHGELLKMLIIINTPQNTGRVGAGNVL